MMKICKKRDKSFDVLIKNGTANITLVDWATRLVNECEAKKRKGDPRLTKGQYQKENYHHLKQFDKTFIQTAIILGYLETSFWIIKTLNKFCILNYHQALCYR